MQNVLDTLRERGFLAQITFEDELYKQLEKEPTVFYVGFDPTATSLHFGHFIPIIAMAHMQRAGHIPIALVGGGTAMIGDPSGKTDMRRMMTVETIDHNVSCIKKQMERFIEFGEGKARIVNNADWIRSLGYMGFLRDVGALFSVNRMLTAECYRQRLERGLTFLEFNYMLMQSYDFLQLYKKYNCRLQMGGDDQWSNMLAGADLIRRKEHEPAYACTFKLLMNHEGKKMGKTEKGALWLDADLCSPFDFYQYWRNVDDSDVKKCLSLLTFLPMDEVNRLAALEGSQINEAKKVLAFECTKLVHGEEEAQKAQQAAAALFGGAAQSADVPTYVWTQAQMAQDCRLTTLLNLCGLCSSNGDARKQIQQNAVVMNDAKVTDINFTLTADMFPADGILLRKGKKNYCRVILK
ncbi:MAG: tyrosine--tRNA ligase [Clostridiales bacterium]|nr:tyrosine--tRNA ligase [Clostridiales bacterium]